LDDSAITCGVYEAEMQKIKMVAAILLAPRKLQLVGAMKSTHHQVKNELLISRKIDWLPNE